MSTSIDDLFPEGVPEPQPAPSETTDTPENWVLHTADNPLYPPLNAIPDAVRQVRNISVEMSDIVEQHAAMIQDLYSTRLAPPEDGELTTGVPPSDSALSSLSKSVEKLLRKQAIILHDLKTFQLRQEAFERGMMRSKLELERKIEYQDRKLAFLDKELNQRHLKAAHEIIMAHTNTASHSADIEALWQAITKVDVKGAAKADKRRSTSNFDHYNWWRSKILNTMNIDCQRADSYTRFRINDSIATLNGLTKSLATLQPTGVRSLEASSHPVGGQPLSSLYKCAAIALKALKDVLASAKYGFLYGQESNSGQALVDRTAATNMPPRSGAGVKRSCDRDWCEEFAGRETASKRARMTSTEPVRERDHTLESGSTNLYLPRGIDRYVPHE